MLRDFKPTIVFLLVFFGSYLILSLLYGQFIRSYDTQRPAEVDPITMALSEELNWILSQWAEEAHYQPNAQWGRTAAAEQTYNDHYVNGRYVLSLEEGCNGINISILFTCFLLAFRGNFKSTFLYGLVGLVLIHAVNILRLLALIVLNYRGQDALFHFFHKYLFTAVVYLFVMLMWWVWVRYFSGKMTRDEKVVH